MEANMGYVVAISIEDRLKYLSFSMSERKDQHGFLNAITNS